ncbi:hypothetical protein BH09SUM1_BH09SUM1_20330 [soil metagenome]
MDPYYQVRHPATAKKNFFSCHAQAVLVAGECISWKTIPGLLAPGWRVFKLSRRNVVSIHEMVTAIPPFLEMVRATKEVTYYAFRDESGTVTGRPPVVTVDGRRGNLIGGRLTCTFETEKALGPFPRNTKADEIDLRKREFLETEDYGKIFIHRIPRDISAEVAPVIPEFEELLRVLQTLPPYENVGVLIGPLATDRKAAMDKMRKNPDFLKLSRLAEETKKIFE